MNFSEQQAIKKYASFLNSTVEKEELLFSLRGTFPRYQAYFEQVEKDDTQQVSDIILFLKDVTESFSRVCESLEECSQEYIASMLKDYTSLVEVDTSEDVGAEATLNIVSDHIHCDIVLDIAKSVLQSGMKEVIIDGPQGSGRTSMIADIQHILEEQSYSCLMIDLASARSQYLASELEHFVELPYSNRKAVFLDNCKKENINTLKFNDGGEDELSLLESMRSNEVVILYIPEYIDITEDLPDITHFVIPHLNALQIDQLLSTNFEFSETERNFIAEEFQKCPQYPIHLFLVATLFISVSRSRFELISLLPRTNNSDQFLEEIFCEIFRTRDNPDELYVLAGLQLFQNIDGATLRDLFQTLHYHSYSESMLHSFVQELLSCRLISQKGDRYFLCSKQLVHLKSHEEYARISERVLFGFLRLNLLAVIHIVDNLDQDGGDVDATDLWKIKKGIFLKALTQDFKIEGEFATIARYRFQAVAQLRRLWQVQCISFIEAINVYERFMSWSNNLPTSDMDKTQLELKRTALTHYISLFFYFGKAFEYADALPKIFIYVDKVISKLGTPTDELYCELLSYIIEIKINNGETGEAHKNLRQLLAVQRKLPDVSDEMVAKTKIRLGQLVTLQPELQGPEDHESADSSPIYSKRMNIQLRINAGDRCYIRHDFDGADFHYQFSIFALEKSNEEDRELLETKKKLRCSIGKIKLQNHREHWIKKCLEDFKKCQEYHGQLEIGRLETKFNVYSAVAYLLIGENSKAMHEILTFWKAANKSMFIAVTDLEVQKNISRNLQERLQGPEVNHLDNHIYEGKVNFLYLKSTNFHWVRHQLTDEIIDVHPAANEREIRAATLQFPNHGSSSNKGLVVAFLENHHTRVNSDNTAFSDLSTITRGMDEVQSNFMDDLEVDSLEHDSIVNSVYRTAFSVAREVAHKAKIGFLQSLTSSVWDQLAS